MAGIDFTIVTYKGTGPLTTDLIGGHVPLAFNVLAPAIGNLKSGTLRALAVAAPSRSSLLPDVPTAAEAGLPGFEAVLHYGLLAPAGTPKAIVERLNKELRAIVATPRGARAHRGRRRRSDAVLAGGIRRRHRSRGGQVGRADPQAQAEGGVILRHLPVVARPRIQQQIRRFTSIFELNENSMSYQDDTSDQEQCAGDAGKINAMLRETEQTIMIEQDRPEQLPCHQQRHTAAAPRRGKRNMDTTMYMVPNNPPIHDHMELCWTVAADGQGSRVARRMMAMVSVPTR